MRKRQRGTMIFLYRENKTGARRPLEELTGRGWLQDRIASEQRFVGNNHSTGRKQSDPELGEDTASVALATVVLVPNVLLTRRFWKSVSPVSHRGAAEILPGSQK